MKRTWSRLERLVVKLQSWAADRRLGIDTRGTIEPRSPGAYSCATLSYPEVDGVLDALDLRADDVFVDVGCGKGRVVCRAAARNVKAVEGIEIEPAIATLARQNVGRTRARAPVAVHEMPAQHYDYGRATVLFLFNPFSGDILDQVLDRIERTRAPGRPLRLVYVFPKHSDVLARRPWLSREPGARVGAVPSQHDIELWRAAG